VFLTVLMLLGSLVVLTLGAELLVRGAAGLAKRLGVSSFVIGLTIVGFGTSSPELGTGITAAIRGVDDINVGNVIGSNIVNIALILGIGSLIAPTPVKMHLVRIETLIVIGLSFIPYLALLAGGYVTRGMGAVFVAALVVYVARGYVQGRREAGRTSDDLEKELESELGLDKPGFFSRTPGGILLVILGLILLMGGADRLVHSSQLIARALGLSELTIALTVIALGTSAPELFTTIIAAVRKQADIAVGNILGSNVFNLLGILGATSMVASQRVSPQVLWLDAPLMIVLSIALIPIMSTRARISRSEGALLVAVYFAYMVVLFTLAPGWFPPPPPSP
jgi:cation:H+ antiporter